MERLLYQRRGVIYYDQDDIEAMIQRAKMPTLTGKPGVPHIKIPGGDVICHPSRHTWRFTFFNAVRVKRQPVNSIGITHDGFGSLRAEKLFKIGSVWRANGFGIKEEQVRISYPQTLPYVDRC